jgi:hypothetical protein
MTEKFMLHMYTTLLLSNTQLQCLSPFFHSIFPFFPYFFVSFLHTFLLFLSFIFQSSIKVFCSYFVVKSDLILTQLWLKCSFSDKFQEVQYRMKLYEKNKYPRRLLQIKILLLHMFTHQIVSICQKYESNFSSSCTGQQL